MSKFEECWECFNEENRPDECDLCSIRCSRFVYKDKCKKCHLTEEHQKMLGCIWNEDGFCMEGPSVCTESDDDEFFKEAQP